MARRKNEPLGVRIMTVDENGNTVCIFDRSHASGTMDNPYKDENACEKLNRVVCERLSRIASEIYTNRPEAFPE